jgi:hypothetical protein
MGNGKWEMGKAGKGKREKGNGIVRHPAKPGYEVKALGFPALSRFPFPISPFPLFPFPRDC